MTNSPSGDSNRVALSVVESTEDVIDVQATPGTRMESRADREVQPKTPPKTGRTKTSRAKARPGKAPETPLPSTESSSKSSGAFDLTSPEFYLNRELTWLAFNKRVLNEAADSRTPLLERVKFLEAADKGHAAVFEGIGQGCFVLRRGHRLCVTRSIAPKGPKHISPGQSVAPPWVADP